MNNLVYDLEHQVEAAPHGPSSEEEINPKIASDILYWSKKFGVTGQLLHEAIRVHGTKVEKIQHALEHNDVSLE